MRAFYITNRLQDQFLLDACTDTFNILQEQGFIVDPSFFFSSSSKDGQNFIDSHEKWKKSIEENDVLVADISTFSNGIGFMIAHALHCRKNVLCIYHKESPMPPSTTIRGESVKNSLLTFKTYLPGDLVGIIQNFKETSEKTKNIKFILNLPNRISMYLDWKAFETKESKAEIVRGVLRDQKR